MVATKPPSREKRVELHSYAITVPRDEVALMLRAVTRLVDEGFGSQQIAEVIATLDLLYSGDVLTKRYKVAHGDRYAELEIQIFLDNPTEPALYFFAPHALRQRIAQYGEDLKQMLHDRNQFVDGPERLVDASPGDEGWEIRGEGLGIRD